MRLRFVMWFIIGMFALTCFHVYGDTIVDKDEVCEEVRYRMNTIGSEIDDISSQITEKKMIQYVAKQAHAEHMSTSLLSKKNSLPQVIAKNKMVALEREVLELQDEIDRLAEQGTVLIQVYNRYAFEYQRFECKFIPTRED